jgi:hypothetical protein
MKHAVYITISELTDEFPTTDELTDIMKTLSARTAAVVALRLNTIFRRCTGTDAADMGTFQKWVATNYLDEEIRGALGKKFGDAIVRDGTMELEQLLTRKADKTDKKV